MVCALCCQTLVPCLSCSLPHLALKHLQPWCIPALGTGDLQGCVWQQRVWGWIWQVCKGRQLSQGGLQGRPPGSTWGPRGMWHPVLIFPPVPSSPSARKPSAPLGATRLPCLSAFGFFIHNAVGEAGRQSSSVFLGCVFPFRGGSLELLQITCERLFSILASQQFHPVLILVWSCVQKGGTALPSAEPWWHLATGSPPHAGAAPEAPLLHGF